MKNILVTGGAGFIGSHLVDKLLAEKNWKVTVIDNFDDFYSPFLKHNNIKKHLADPLYTLASGDILSEEILDEVFSTTKFDTIVHLAARAGVRPSLTHPHLYSETNIQGTLNLLEYAKKYKVKQFVFGSSSSVYGNNCKVPFNESDLVNQPISPYAMTKATGELLCHTYSHLYDIQTVCLRFFTVYGPRQRPDLAIRKFTRLISLKKPIQVYGNGNTYRDYTYVSDIVKGIRSAIDYDKTKFEIFNLGDSQTVKLSRLIELIEKALNTKAIIERLPLQPGDVTQTYADIDKAKRLLDYHPNVSIEQGINKFVRWFVNEYPPKSKKTKALAYPATIDNAKNDRAKVRSFL